MVISIYLIYGKLDFICYYEAIRLQQPDSMMTVICLPRLTTLGSDYTQLVKKYKCIHSYPDGTYLFTMHIKDSTFENNTIFTSCPYNLLLADEFISDRRLQSLHAKQNNADCESQIYVNTLK
jgi:hypothetical protein